MNQLLSSWQNKKIYCIHDCDLDGVISFIVTLFYIKPIVQAFQYTLSSDRKMGGFDLAVAIDSDVIIFVDIAPTETLYKKLVTLNKEIYIFDHHESSYTLLKDIVPKKNYFYDVDRCGAKILFDALSVNERISRVLYQMVELCNIYDLFITESALWKDAKDFNNILYESVNWFKKEPENIRYNSFIEVQLQKIKTSRIFYFTAYEKELAKKGEQKEKKQLDYARNCLKIRKDMSGNTFGYFECGSKLSYVAMTLLKERPALQYVIGHSTYKETYLNEPNGKLSLRSQKDFDVSKIAEKFGGGGHKTAAGIEVSLEMFEQVKQGTLYLN